MRTARPVEDLKWKHREIVIEIVRRVGNEHRNAKHKKWRGFAHGAAHGKNGAR